MILSFSEKWLQLEQDLPLGDLLNARLASNESDSLYLAIDAEGMRHLLLILSENDEELQDESSKGLSVVTRELTQFSEHLTRWIDIKCIDPNGISILDSICEDIIHQLIADLRSPAEIVKRVLSKWRRFWGALPTVVFSRDELLGLFGELWFLSQWLLPFQTHLAVVKSWRGPYASRHDFEFTENSIEVKVTSSSRGRVHSINGFDQLNPPESGRLYLFSMQVREEAGASNTLPSVIEHCRIQLANDPETLEIFERSLFQTGYSDLHDAEYDKVKFRIAESVLFRVEDDFPRLTDGNFVNGLPKGIERIDYEINLNTFDNLIFATAPSLFSLV
jgi:hypothetical protein